MYLFCTALLVGQSRDRFPVVSLGIFSAGPPTELCAPRSTQTLKVSTRNLSWGKGGRCVWLTTYHPCNAETSRKSGVLIYPEPLGPPRPVGGQLYFYTQPIRSQNVKKVSKRKSKHDFREHWLSDSHTLHRGANEFIS